MREAFRLITKPSGWLGALGLLALSGCSHTQYRIFDPAGPISAAELRFTIIDVAVMLVLIIPTGLAITIFLFRYRKSRNARFDPDTSNSIPLDIAFWVVPVLTVALLGYFSMRGVYGINPYGPSLLAPGKPGAAPGKSLIINVIATDWQFVFIYPDQHIATIDTLTIPANRTVVFRLTATSVVNSFYIPQIISMIDMMPSMRTRDITVARRLGTYEGFSANLSGAGFAWMRFPTHVVTAAQFKSWVAKTQGGGGMLDYARFEKIAQPTINLHQTPSYFAAVEPRLFEHVIKAAMDGKIYPVKHALTEHMADDAKNGAPYIKSSANGS